MDRAPFHGLTLFLVMHLISCSFKLSQGNIQCELVLSEELNFDELPCLSSREEEDKGMDDADIRNFLIHYFDLDIKIKHSCNLVSHQH